MHSLASITKNARIFCTAFDPLSLAVLLSYRLSRTCDGFYNFVERANLLSVSLLWQRSFKRRNCVDVSLKETTLSQTLQRKVNCKINNVYAVQDRHKV